MVRGDSGNQVGTRMENEDSLEVNRTNWTYYGEVNIKSAPKDIPTNHNDGICWERGRYDQTNWGTNTPPPPLPNATKIHNKR